MMVHPRIIIHAVRLSPVAFSLQTDSRLCSVSLIPCLQSLTWSPLRQDTLRPLSSADDPVYPCIGIRPLCHYFPAMVRLHTFRVCPMDSIFNGYLSHMILNVHGMYGLFNAEWK